MKTLINKISYLFKNNWPIIIIIIISLILHVMSLNELGFKYSINSDDASYISSGLTFLKEGKITMHGVISAQIMPGLTFLIAFIGLIFGDGYSFMVALKLLYMMMGITTIIVVYKIMRIYSNKYISALTCIPFLLVDYIWMDNLILTETPFILLLSLLIYHTLKISIKPNNKDFIFIVIYYIIAVFIRPNIGVFPISLIIFLILKKYNTKLLIKQLFIAGMALLAVLTPWTIRNYKVFGKFIPLTYGTGNPLLLGTYQGYGYPQDEELDYIANVDNKMSNEMKYYLDNPKEKEYMTRFYLLEYDGMKAKYRMNSWWKKDKKSMLISYLYYKPKELIISTFYWDEIFGINSKKLLILKKIEFCLAILGTIVCLIDKTKTKEILFLGLIYFSQIVIYSYTFAFDRYAISINFIKFLVIGFGISVIYTRLVNIRRSKSESTTSNTGIQRTTKYRKYNKQNKKNTKK